MNLLMPKIKVPSVLKKTVITKRQKFAASVIILSAILFLVEHFLGKSGIYLIIVLSFFTDVLLYWSLRKDLKGNFSPQVFILPFFYTLAFGLFYLLVPERLIVKLFITMIYALGAYSVFLSQNIFIVSSIRTIALFSSARTVSFVVTLLSYFFLTNVIFSLHLNIILTNILLVLCSLPLIIQSIWNYSTDKRLKEGIPWGVMLTLCIIEVSLLLWFWPSTPTIIALFLTGFFYIILGLSHLWFEKRLFKSVFWEYVWVAIVVFFVLVAFTPWS